MKNCNPLLIKMSDEFDRTGNDRFDSTFFIGFPDRMLDDLESLGFIYRTHDVADTIVLTKKGYNSVKG